MLRGDVMRPSIDFARAVLGFLWKRLKYTVVGWRAWWFVFVPGEFLNILLGLATWYFFTFYLASTGRVGDIISYIILGMGVNTVLRSALVHLYWAIHGLYSGYLESGGFRMRYWEYYSLAGVPKYVAVVGFMVFDNLRSFVSLALYLVVGVFVFRVISGSLQSYALALSLLLTGYLATFTLGVLVASSFWFFVRYRELTLNPFVWVIDALVPVVSGMYYPLDVLPPYLRAVGELLPHTHTIEAIRVALGVSRGDIVPHAAVLLVYISLLPVAVLVFRKCEHWALRKSGIL
ncbi:ABC transporter permease [Infirmifilum lucidum]|uniref:ABC transporter permease n=1 Tax=Infirmifilum lucidum TaxID=2776706 RepID=A0A7L9FHH4_9CREN|nr:ABC transporter permease [Infirmifilum lucidum]QOJ79101.1 ABC transporter permease [Infirmifilum lucidum]